MKILGIKTSTNNINSPEGKKIFRFGSNYNNGLFNSAVYVKPVQFDKLQKDTINTALSELSNIEFSQNDIIYMRNLGIELPFKCGSEIVDFIKNNNVDIQYASFSNPNIHACLDYKPLKATLLVNSNYKDMAEFSDVLAISEALAHEAAHAKDNDVSNSIQEELECLALNVVIHQAYKAKYNNVFNNKTSFLYIEGVNLYNKIFYDFDFSKKALKNRVAQKYGHLNPGDSKHNASALALEIKQIYNQNLNNS